MLAGFLTAAMQNRALMGERGLDPVQPGHRPTPAFDLIGFGDVQLSIVAWSGVLLSLLLLSGALCSPLQVHERLPATKPLSFNSALTSWAASVIPMLNLHSSVVFRSVAGTHTQLLRACSATALVAFKMPTESFCKQMGSSYHVIIDYSKCP